MKVKRLEIVVEMVYADDFLDALRAAGVDGYTLIRNVSGKGSRGERLGDELTDVSRNVCIIAACPVQLIDRVTNSLRPLLKEFGGMCLVSDAMWVED
jgi:nitrogen regulatory protein PII